jgi:hypothetical protein
MYALGQLARSPDELVELLDVSVEECLDGQTWVVDAACRWLPLERLREVVARSRLHLEVSPACEFASSVLRHADRREHMERTPVRHLAFPETVLAEWGARYRGRTGHPTWPEFGSSETVAVVGGRAAPCPYCGRVTERLLRLDLELVLPVETGHRPVEFTWCMTCSAYTREATFAEVDADGSPRILPMDFLVEPRAADEELEPFPATPVGLVDLGPRWRRQDWGEASWVENLHRVGGEPTWVQSDAVPACCRCGVATVFVAQLAVSDLWDGEGMAFLFWCPDCSVSAMVYQQT